MRVEEFTPVVDGWESIEQRALLEHRWWTVDELDATVTSGLPDASCSSSCRRVLDDGITVPMELSGE